MDLADKRRRRRVHHLVYEFGYNTKAASSGQGTGTTTIDISGPVADGGMMVSGTDFWWNTVRARATNTCEVYPSGNVKCSQLPTRSHPIQLTLFPLLAHNFFHGLATEREIELAAQLSRNGGNSSGGLRDRGPVLPPGIATTRCTVKAQSPMPAPLILITAQGTLNQQSGRHLKATSKQSIVYDPVAKIPAIVNDVRTHIPMRSVYSNDMIELKLRRLEVRLIASRTACQARPHQ